MPDDRVCLSLPWPGITTNHLWRRAMSGGMYLHPKAQAFKNEVALAVHQSGQRLPSGDLSLTLWLRALKARRYDVDNMIKTVQDALFEAFGEDDSRVVELHAYKMPMGQAGIEVLIAAAQPSGGGER